MSQPTRGGAVNANVTERLSAMFYETEYYQTKAARDARAADLKSRGFPFKKRSARNVVLSPSSVEDYSGYTTPNGFGGTSAQWFSALYIVEY